MAPRTYLNFDLLLERAKGGTFRARVTSSPVGESRSARFEVPWDETQLENLLLKLDPGRSGTRRAVVDSHNQASMELGGRLYEAVFNEELRLAWSRSLDVARAGGHGLRLRLRLTEAPAIAGLPWELLYDRRSNSYLAQSDRTPLVRYMEVAEPPQPLLVNGSLRILVVISSPVDQEELDTESEWRKINEALREPVAQGRIRLDRLPQATMSHLAAWLRHHEVHVLHFIGHGDYDARLQDGVLLFCDIYGRSVPVAPSVMGPIVHDHDSLRLIVLNACRSARVDETDPFSGMAQGLIQQHATAVVAMQFPISDRAAGTFASQFYDAVALGSPVDQAVAVGRQSLLIEHGAEWATPVLFLRAPDGDIFSHITPESGLDGPEADSPTESPTVAIRRVSATPSIDAAQPEPTNLHVNPLPPSGDSPDDQHAVNAILQEPVAGGPDRSTVVSNDGPAARGRPRVLRLAMWAVLPLLALLIGGSLAWSAMQPQSATFEAPTVTTTTGGPTSTTSIPTSAPSISSSAPSTAAPEAPPSTAPPIQAATCIINASDYVNKTVDGARDALSRLGCSQIKVVQEKNSKAAGTVLRITPTGTVKRTTTITLTVSSGPTTTTPTSTTTAPRPTTTTSTARPNPGP
jgi:hypothetical protein